MFQCLVFRLHSSDGYEFLARGREAASLPVEHELCNNGTKQLL
jgi:hypothetical protein